MGTALAYAVRMGERLGHRRRRKDARLDPFQPAPLDSQLARNRGHSLRIFALLPDPTGPVLQQSLADLPPAAVGRGGQSVPGLFRREPMAWNAVLGIHISFLPPVVASRIPDGKPSVGMGVNDQPRILWSPRPTLVQGSILVLVALATGFPLDGKPQRGGYPLRRRNPPEGGDNCQVRGGIPALSGRGGIQWDDLAAEARRGWWPGQEMG